MFDRKRFIYDILNINEQDLESGQIQVPELLDALGIKVNYSKSKKLGSIVDEKTGRIVCKSKKGGVIIDTERKSILPRKNKVVTKLVINGNALRGVLRSKNGIVILTNSNDGVIATYYNRETSKMAKSLKLIGKYGIEDKFGITPDGNAKITTCNEISDIVNLLNTKEKQVKTLAKTIKK